MPTDKRDGTEVDIIAANLGSSWVDVPLLILIGYLAWYRCGGKKGLLAENAATLPTAGSARLEAPMDRF
jgi:hypothetical protein